MQNEAADHWIATPRGRLFARVLTPPNPHPENCATIVLFHDSLGCVELWRDFPQQLAIATGLRVVAYDRLGFGRSDPYPATLPLTFIHDEALFAIPRLCEQLGLSTIIPFGHSVGGPMAIATAACLPDKCPAVITESAQSFVEERTISGVRAAKTEFTRPDQIERLARYHGAKARWVLDAWIETWLSPAFADWSLDDDLGAVACSVLALHGDQDEYGSPEHPNRIARMSNGLSRVVILEGCGHVPHREHPERVLSEVSQFLREQSAP